MPKYRAALFALALAAAPSLASAQTTPLPLPPARPAGATDAQKDARKEAFLAMPDADRKAIQDALGWLGHYNGAVDGGFGKRTLDAIMAYQTSVKATADGIVTASQLAALRAAAQKARGAVGFEIMDDAITGARIGLPTRLLEQRPANKTPGKGATRDFAAPDGSLALIINQPIPGRETLEELYRRTSPDIPGLKLTYHAMKAGSFFVVAGELADRKFYTRYDQSPTDPAVVRGFSFTYPLAKAASFDVIALAIANSFDAFPGTKAATSAAATPVPTPVPSPAPNAAPPPPAPVLTATALVIAPGQALTALREADCRDPTVLGKPVKFAKTGPSGTAILSGDFEASASAPMRGHDDGDVVVLSLARAGAKSTLQAADAAPTAIDPTRRAIVTGLAEAARGAPVFDRQGGLVAIVAPFSTPPRRIGGVTLAEPHELIEAATLGDFAGLAAPEPAGATLGAADIARKMRGAIIGVFCVP